MLTQPSAFSISTFGLPVEESSYLDINESVASRHKEVDRKKPFFIMLFRQPRFPSVVDQTMATDHLASANF